MRQIELGDESLTAIGKKIELKFLVEISWFSVLNPQQVFRFLQRGLCRNQAVGSQKQLGVLFVFLRPIRRDGNSVV